MVGVLTPKGQSTYGQDQDDVVLTPFYTAQRKVVGSAQVTAEVSTTTGNGSTNPVLNPYAGVPTTNAVYAASNTLESPFGSTPQVTGVVNNIYVKAVDAKEVDALQTQIQEVLHRRHRIKPNQDNDFTVRNLSEIAEASEASSQVMTLLLAVVASISLLVGGIGIMNIMLVSVTERTREIGIRMAIGARRLHILLQFLVESSLLSILGGLAGGSWESSRRNSVGAGAMADVGISLIGGGRIRIRSGGRSFLRLVSRTQGRITRSDRRAAVRVDKHFG